MPPPQPDRKGRRVLTALLVAAVCGLLVWIFLRQDQAQQRPGPKPQPQEQAKVTYGAPTRTPKARPSRAFNPDRLPPASENEPAPVIDEVTLEKQEVCEGEENLVSVKAHTVNDTDEFLHYTISAGTGQQVPLKVFSAGREEASTSFVMVFGRNNVATTVPVPAYTVKSCQAPRMVAVNYRLNPNTFAEFDFWVGITDFGVKRDQYAPPFRPQSYVWDFGDGTTETTTVPRVTHSYEERAQDTLYTQFLISATVVAAGGDKLVGRTSLQLMNHVFEELVVAKTLRLLVSLNPRFPTMSPGNSMEQGVRIWHTRPDPVTIKKIRIVTHWEPRQKGIEKDTGEEAGSVERILGQKEIPPGRGVETVVSHFQPPEGPHWISMDYFLEGVTVEGWPALGNFSVMMPPRAPTAERNIPETDPVKVAKILEAQRILGKELVTDEDLWRLEREGQFADLKVDPNAKVRTTGSPEGVVRPFVGPTKKQ
ncbi:MAG: PKD domain-containing protein [Deltaproteobacteria bacterium]|nr:PKD domain-containing protein [Deltaproteobacteria bacterium]